MVELGSLLIFVISEFLYNSVISLFFGTFLGLIQLGCGQSNCVKSGLHHIFFDPMASDESQSFLFSSMGPTMLTGPSYGKFL